MEVSEGLLYLGGISADSLLERFGSPLYVYEEDVLINRFRKMRNCFPPDQTIPKRAPRCRNVLEILQQRNLLSGPDQTLDIV